MADELKRALETIMQPGFGETETTPKFALVTPHSHAKKGIGEDWSPEKRGRALLFIWTLANAHPTEWRSKAQIWAELQEFRN